MLNSSDRLTRICVASALPCARPSLRARCRLGSEHRTDALVELRGTRRLDRIGRSLSLTKGQPARCDVESYGEMLYGADHWVALSALDKQHALRGDACGLSDVTQGKAHGHPRSAEALADAAPQLAPRPVAGVGLRGVKRHRGPRAPVAEKDCAFVAIGQPGGRDSERVGGARYGDGAVVGPDAPPWPNRTRSGRGITL